MRRTRRIAIGALVSAALALPLAAQAHVARRERDEARERGDRVAGAAEDLAGRVAHLADRRRVGGQGGAGVEVLEDGRRVVGDERGDG